MKRLESKHPLAIRWFHWINFPVLFVMIWSGILIYWANDVYRIGWGSHTLFHFFPDKFYTKFNIDGRLAEGQAWHWTFMWIFTINGIAYVIYNLVSGEWRYIVPNRSTLREAIQVVLYDLHLVRTHPKRQKFNGAQKIAYTGVILMGFGSLVTGLAIYKPIQFAWITSLLNFPFLGCTGYELARFFHFWLTMAFLGFFVVHVMQVARAGWNNFRAMVTGFEIVEDEEGESTGQLSLDHPKVDHEEMSHVS